MSTISIKTEDRAGVHDDEISRAIVKQLRPLVGDLFSAIRSITINEKTFSVDPPGADKYRSGRQDDPYNDEWYTQDTWLDAYRQVIGGQISLDVASHPDAQYGDHAHKGVNAAVFYTAEDDALSRSWQAESILGAFPYSNGMKEKFTAKFLEELDLNGIKHALIIVPNYFAGWYMDLERRCDVKCTARRRNWNPSDSFGRSPIDETGFYFGPNYREFYTVFSSLGRCVTWHRDEPVKSSSSENISISPKLQTPVVPERPQEDRRWHPQPAGTRDEGYEKIKLLWLETPLSPLSGDGPYADTLWGDATIPILEARKEYLNKQVTHRTRQIDQRIADIRAIADDNSLTLREVYRRSGK